MLKIDLSWCWKHLKGLGLLCEQGKNLVPWENDKATVVALREIAAGFTDEEMNGVEDLQQQESNIIEVEEKSETAISNADQIDKLLQEQLSKLSETQEEPQIEEEIIPKAEEDNVNSDIIKSEENESSVQTLSSEDEKGSINEQDLESIEEQLKRTLRDIEQQDSDKK